MRYSQRLMRNSIAAAMPGEHDGWYFVHVQRLSRVRGLICTNADALVMRVLVGHAVAFDGGADGAGLAVASEALERTDAYTAMPGMAVQVAFAGDPGRDVFALLESPQ